MLVHTLMGGRYPVEGAAAPARLRMWMDVRACAVRYPAEGADLQQGHVEFALLVALANVVQKFQHEKNVDVVRAASA